LELVGSRIVVLNQDGDYPAGDIITVYDHAHPASRYKGVLAVEALASWSWIVIAVWRAHPPRATVVRIVST
jgi:hypothetical protein